MPRPHVGQRVVAVELDALATEAGRSSPVLVSRAGYSNGILTPPTPSTRRLNAQKSIWM